MQGAVAHVNTLPTDGRDAVTATLNRMVAIVRKYKTDYTTVTAARQILVGAGITDTRTQKPQAIRALQHWVRDRVAYVHDPVDLEMIQTPPQTLKLMTGDCDDQAILLAALLTSINLPVRFTGVYFPPGSGQIPGITHVLSEVRFGNGWMPLETIVKNAEPGWFPPGGSRAIAREV